MTLQLVVFDFDLTLSSVHIFNAVAGMGALQKATGRQETHPYGGVLFRFLVLVHCSG